METSSPPVTPIRQYMSPLETSPTSSYRDQLRRRTSSFSSNHDRSPTSIRSKNRFSNASQYSNDFSPDGGGGGGMGNLADELDQLEDEDEGDEDTTEAAVEDDEKQPSPVDGARDSGIDVSYPSKRKSPQVRHFSRPFGIAQQRTPEKKEQEEQEDKLSPELEEVISSIARMASYASTSEDPLIPRTVALLQDLGNQSSLEAGVQRLTTSTNSMTSHLMAQSKTLQGLTTSLWSPLAIFSAPIDLVLIEETVPLVEALLKDLPLPDSAPLQGLQKLDRETANVIHTLSQLTDTLQMGKHTTNTAARHLRTTQTMVAELRRERERAEAARLEPGQSGWNEKVRERWCAGECRDIMSGFEEKCDALREGLVQAGSAVA